MQAEIDNELIRIIVCPECKSDLKITEKKEKFICTHCKNEYSIEDGIPNLLFKKL